MCYYNIEKNRSEFSRREFIHLEGDITVRNQLNTEDTGAAKEME